MGAPSPAGVEESVTILPAYDALEVDQRLPVVAIDPRDIVGVTLDRAVQDAVKIGLQAVELTLGLVDEDAEVGLDRARAKLERDAVRASHRVPPRQEAARIGVIDHDGVDFGALA